MQAIVREILETPYRKKEARDELRGVEERTMNGLVGADHRPVRALLLALPSGRRLRARSCSGEFVAVPARSWQPVTVEGRDEDGS